MARITQYTRKVFLNRANAGRISAAGEAAGGVKARQHSLDAQQHNRNATIAGNLGDEIMAQRAANGKVRAQERWNATERELITAYQKRRNEAQQNPTGFADDFDKFHVDMIGGIETSLKDEDGDFDMDYFRQLASRNRNSYFNQASDFENSQRLQNTFSGAETSLDEMAVNFALSDPSYKDFADYTDKVASYSKEVGGDIFSPQDTLRLTEYGMDNAAKTFINQQLQNDPISARRVIEYGSGGADNVIDFFIDDIEGGAKIAKEPRGAIAKYGINSEANPNVDVRNLTREGAVEIYKKKYWDKRLDDMTPSMQAVAFDALINQGGGKKTWDMIEAANGNPYSLLAARQDFLNGLVQADLAKPESQRQGHAAAAAGWKNRINEMTNFVNTLEGGGADFLDRAKLIDPSIIMEAKAKIPAAMSDLRKAQEDAAERKNQVDVFTQINNEADLQKTIYNSKIPVQERIRAVREADFRGTVRDNFAKEGIAYLKTFDGSKKAQPSTAAKYSAFEELTQDLQQIRRDLGGTTDEAAIKINSKTLKKYQEFQKKVMAYASPDKNLISESEVNNFIGDFSAGIMTALEENTTDGGIGRLAFGVQDPYGHALDRVDKYLKNNGREGDLIYKKNLIMGFQEHLGDYQSSGNTAQDERTIDDALANAQKSMNSRNFAGAIDTANPPNKVVQPVPTVAPEHRFNTVEEMEAAGLPDGTPVMVAGGIGYARK